MPTLLQKKKRKRGRLASRNSAKLVPAPQACSPDGQKVDRTTKRKGCRLNISATSTENMTQEKKTRKPKAAVPGCSGARAPMDGHPRISSAP